MDAKLHTIPPGEYKDKTFQWGSGGCEAEACTPPEVLFRY